MPAAWRASENARRDETTPAKTRGVSGGSKASATRDDGAETPGAKNEPGGPLSPALAKLSSTYTPGILPPRPDRAAFDAFAAGEAAAFERTGRDADASEALAARTLADESPTVTMRVPPPPGAASPRRRVRIAGALLLLSRALLRSGVLPRWPRRHSR